MTKRLHHEEWVSRNNDPWRLRCPVCESTSWRRKVVKPKTREINYRHDTEVHHDNRKTHMCGQYWCEVCQEQSDGLLDMRTGEIVCRENDYIPQEIIKHKPDERNKESAPSAHYRASVTGKR